MPSDAPLPPEFIGLADRVQFVQRKNDNEFSSSCPRCGGSIHPDGSYPDRFVMWRVSKFGTPLGACLRGHCNFKWSPQKEDANWTPEELQEFRAKAAATEAAFAQETEIRLAELSEKIKANQEYVRYNNDGLDSDEVTEYWEARGVPHSWQLHLYLGYIADYSVTGRLSHYISPAYTLPVFSEVGRIENIKVRVANPKDDNDRYRNLYKSGCQHLYSPNYRNDPANHVLLMEGEIKSIVACAYGGVNTNQVTVYGVQSKQPEERLLKKLKDFDAVYIALDPDAYRRSYYYDMRTGEKKESTIAAVEVARKVGFDRARFVLPPKGTKFDDAILQGYNFSNALKMAIKPERLQNEY
jgi:hypothetical protein